MLEKFRILGFSHHTTPLKFREKLTFKEEEARSFIVRMKDLLGVEEALLISTCNRTEFYYVSDENKDSDIISLLKIEKNFQVESEEFEDYFISESDIDAVRHLFEVALGLDARVLGDIQISNQVKKAYQASADENLAGPLLHRLLHSIFFTNKRVVQETEFRDGAASTSYASVYLTHQFIKNFKNPKILVLGLGEIGNNIAEDLQGTVGEIFVSTRNSEKATEIAKNLGFKSIELLEALKNISDFDVVISSLAVSSPVIKSFNYPDKLIVQKLLIDLSVPRSIDFEVEKVPGILLYNIDQIEQKTSSIQENRKNAIPKVRAIMEEAISDFSNWTQDMEVSPTIKKLKNALDDIRKEELKRYLNKVSEKEWNLLDKASKNIIQKVIKMPVLELKAACKRGDSEQLVEVLNELFDLEKPKVDSK